MAKASRTNFQNELGQKILPEFLCRVHWHFSTMLRMKKKPIDKSISNAPIT
jgi:hypothetical protein